MSIKTYALTTSQRFADYAGLGTLAGADLTLADRLVDSVTEYIENYIDFRVQKTTYTEEEYSTEDGQILVLDHSPIVSGETFVLARRTSPMNFDEWENVNSEYYHVEEDTGIIYGASGWKFSRTRYGFRATYTAGYDYDNSSSFLSDTKGGDIELAAWMLLQAIWSIRKSGTGVKSETIGDYKIVYGRITMEDADIKSILDKYTQEDTFGVLTPLQV